MGLLRSPLGTVLVIAGAVTALLLGLAVVRVDQTTRPHRQIPERIDFESIMLRVEEVEFRSTDGVRLSGWLFPGRPGSTPVILGHDLGGSKNSVVHLAVALGKEGFTPLAFDFRGHGASAGGRSTLGLDERRDVRAAVEFLTGNGLADEGRIGIYGVGMGAHAAVLAAAECPELKVLVLDGLYPDAGYPLARELFAGWTFARRHLAIVPVGIFTVLNQSRLRKHRAADELTRMLGRDILLLASERDELLSEAVKAMYHRLPEQTDVDGNLVLMPGTQADGLYGEELAQYQERVAGFFRDRLN